MSDSEMESKSQGSSSKPSMMGNHKKAWLLVIILVVAIIAGVVAAILVSDTNSSGVCFQNVGGLCSTNPNLSCFPSGLFAQFDVSKPNPPIGLLVLSEETVAYIKSTDPTAQIPDVSGGFIGKNSNWTSGALDELFKLMSKNIGNELLFLVQKFSDTNEIMIFGGNVQEIVMNYGQSKVNVLPSAQSYLVGSESVLSTMKYHKSLSCGAPLPGENNISLSRAVEMGGPGYEEAHKNFLA